MKQLLLLVVAACIAMTTQARNFYFSNNSGDDSRTAQQAQNPATPWKSLNKLNAYFSSLQPGDSALFNRGEVFYGSFTVSRSGSAGAPIVIAAYGTGKRPEFTGFTTLNNWTSLGNNIWETECASCMEGLNTVLIDASLKPMGRYPNLNTPNGGHNLIDTHYGKEYITDYELNGSTNWTGAELVIRKNEWVIDRGRILEHSGNTMRYENTSGYEPIDNYGYFIQNDPRTLDQDGEWYLNPTQHRLRIFSSVNPNSRLVKASTVDALISIVAQNYISFDNIQITGANLIGLKMEFANNIAVRNSDILHSGTFGIKAFVSDNFTVESTNINYALSNAIYAAPYCNNTLLRKNTIHNIGLYAGMGNSNNQTYEGIVTHGTSNMIELNRLDSIGYVAIRFYGDNSTVQRNFIKDFALTKDDGGGIYTNGDLEFFNQKVLNNVVLNGRGNPAGTGTDIPTAASGIYMDDRTANVEIIGNTVANCSENGIFLHNAHEIVVKNNTLYNNHTQTALVHDVIAPDDPIRNIEMEYNILFSKGAKQVTSNLISRRNDLDQFGHFDKNSYCRPVDESLVINTRAIDNEQTYDLAGWQNAFNRDWNGKKSPMEIPSFTSKYIGNNLFSNSTFNNNVNNAGTFSQPYNSSATWVNDGKLDGGSMKIDYNKSTGQAGGVDVILSIGAITAGKDYVVNFSMFGINTDAILSVFLRQNSNPYINLTEVANFKNTNTRSEQQFNFHATASSNTASLVFRVNSVDCPLYLDNIQLYEAAITMTDVDKYVRFEYNASESPKTIALDGNYMDVDKNTYANSMTLAPFSSVILMEMATSTLPLKFVEFKGKKNSKNVDLNWITANEINTSHFEIERSANGTNYSKIGSVVSSNVAQGTSMYKFTDYNPMNNNNYYRLKQFDKDGKSSYSSIVVINYSADLKMTVSPNPAVENIHVSLNTPLTNQKATMSIVTLSGVTVKSMPVILSSEALTVNVSGFPAGIYVVHVAGEGINFNERFVKQ